MVGDTSCNAIGICGRETLARRPSEGTREAEEDEEEDLVGLRENEEGVALIVDACHCTVAHLWGRRAHSYKGRPVGRYGCADH